jgi:hypothetical protein
MNQFDLSRREFLRLTATSIGGLLLVACGSAPPTTPPSAFTPQAPTGLTPNGEALQPARGFQTLLANSEHVVGPDRFALGLIENGQAVQDAAVHLRFFDLTSGQPVLKGEADAPFYGDNLGAAGVYVTHTTFDKAGQWGVEVTAQEPGQALKTARLAFQVLAQDPTPAIGEPAPRTRNLTLKDVGGDRHKICSAVEDDSPLHQMTIADAVTSGKPTAILFATPAFCTSRTCGPSLEVVKALAQRYQGPVNFIHIEVYKDFQTFAPADAMLEWDLQTEPWLFFVGKDGKVFEKFEGGITLREVESEFLKFI